MGASKNILIVETEDGGYSEKVAVENALLVNGTVAVGKVPTGQADGTVDWEDGGVTSIRISATNLTRF